MNLQRRISRVQKNTRCRDCAVKDHSALKNCPAECLEIISSSKKVIGYLKGRRIVMEGTVSSYIYFVKSGKIKIYSSDEKGREMIIRFAKSGDVIGFEDVEKNSEYTLSAMAIDDTVLCCMDYNAFHQLIRHYPELSLGLLKYYKEELQNAIIKSTKLARLNVPGKVAYALLIMQQAYGSDEKDNTLNLTLSRKDIANLAFTTKEQVSKTFSAFRQQGIIKITGNKQITLVNTDALHSLAQM